MGVKWRWNRGWRTSHRWISGVLWVETLSTTRWTSRSSGTRAVDEVQEASELDGPVAFGHVGDDLARCHVERRVEVGGAASHVVMGAPFGEPRTQREHRCGAVERLDLGLLVDAEHEGRVGRVDVEAHDVADLVHEERVGRELEGLDQMRFQPEGPPDPRDRRLAHPGRLGHRAGRPVRGVSRRLLERLDDDQLHASSPVCAGHRAEVRRAIPRAARPGTSSAISSRCHERCQALLPPRCCSCRPPPTAQCDNAGRETAHSCVAGPSAQGWTALPRSTGGARGTDWALRLPSSLMTTRTRAREREFPTRSLFLTQITSRSCRENGRRIQTQ